MSDLGWDGERVVPGKTPELNFRESQMRYGFARNLAKGRVVLDIASGTGIGTHDLFKAGAIACIGLDLNLPAVRYAKSHYENCEFAVCDAHSLCLPDRSVDLVVSFETIEHLDNPRKFLSECKRVLRPNGLALCSTPNRETSRWSPQNPFHVTEMTTKELTLLMQEFFADCRIYGQATVEYPLFLTKKMAGKMLEQLHLKQYLRKLVPAPLSQTCTLTEFPEQDGHCPKLEVSPYIPVWDKKPQYILALGRRDS